MAYRILALGFKVKMAFCLAHCGLSAFWFWASTRAWLRRRSTLGFTSIVAYALAGWASAWPWLGASKTWASIFRWLWRNKPLGLHYRVGLARARNLWVPRSLWL